MGAIMPVVVPLSRCNNAHFTHTLRELYALVKFSFDVSNEIFFDTFGVSQSILNDNCNYISFGISNNVSNDIPNNILLHIKSDVIAVSLLLLIVSFQNINYSIKQQHYSISSNYKIPKLV